MEPILLSERLLLPLIALLAILMGGLPERCDTEPPVPLEPLYQVQITRMAQNDAELALIARAEAHCPPYEDVAAVWETTPPPPGPDCLWHHDSTEGIRIPFAITRQAIEYYADTISEWEARGRYARAFFNYTAQVQTVPLDDTAPPEAAQAVHMSLRFNFAFCRNDECGTLILKRRVVYFDAAGNLVAVAGDGFTEVLIA